MKELPNQSIEVVTLFLQKLEKLNDKERAVLITTIDLLNHPVFITNDLKS